MSWSRECSTLAGPLSTMGWDSGLTGRGEACINFSLWPEKNRHVSPGAGKRQNSAASGLCALNHRVGFLGICHGFHLPHEYA